MDIREAFGLTPQAGLCQARTRASLQSLLPAAPGAGHCFTPLRARDLGLAGAEICPQLGTQPGFFLPQ